MYYLRYQNYWSPKALFSNWEVWLKLLLIETGKVWQFCIQCQVSPHILTGICVTFQLQTTKLQYFFHSLKLSQLYPSEPHSRNTEAHIKQYLQYREKFSLENFATAQSLKHSLCKEGMRLVLEREKIVPKMHCIEGSR